MAGSEWVLGVIGGSGVAGLDGLENVEGISVHTPWGQPSAALTSGTLHGIRLVFLPRHDQGHRHSPSTINARANIDALKRAGCTDVLSLSAVGSLREDLHPGHFVIIDQYIDRTFAREKSFFGEGLVAHVSMADPVCTRLARLAGAAAELDAALLVNPYDLDGVADAIARAAAMPLAERRERWESMMRPITGYDIHAWCRRFVETLRAAASSR